MYTLILLVALVAVYLVLLKLYIREDIGGEFDHATKLKMTLSATFCAVGALGLVSSVIYGLPCVSIAASALILCALVCALTGDYFLRFITRDAKKFNRGVLFFAGAQAFLLASMFFVQGVGVAEFIVTAVLLCAALVLMKKQNWQLGSSQIPLTVYMILLSLMMAKAVVTVVQDGFSSISYLLTAVGAVLFWTSDLLLGIWNYHSRKDSINAGNSVTYFVGTLLIAISLQPLFMV
ncbi:MAG: lysoplasmalogenase family protein [Christensenella sp.]